VAQLNIYLAPADDLKSRLDTGASALGVTPNTLARLVVDEFLDAYVGVALEAENMKQQSFRDLHDRLKHRAVTLGNRRFEAGTEAAEFRSAEEMRRKPRKRVSQRTAGTAVAASR
jgi:hypothetical protein